MSKIRIVVSGPQGVGKTRLIETVVLPALRNVGLRVWVADEDPEPGIFCPPAPGHRGSEGDPEIHIVITNAEASK